MQFLLMICDREEDQPQFGSPEFMEYMKRWMELEEEGKKRGILLKGGGKLDTANKARTVRKRGGKVHITDGPYTESKELLGGYTVLECDSIEDALDYAAKIPVAEWGSVEVRPFQQSRYDTKL